MPNIEQHRHNNFSVRANYVPASGEVFFDTDVGCTFMGDGASYGGLQIGQPNITVTSATTFGVVDATDVGKLYVFTGAGCAVSLCQAGSAQSGLIPAQSGLEILNLGSGNVVITPATSTINGAATLTLGIGDSAVIISNGTNYYAKVGKVAGASGGTVTSVGTGNGLTGGPITGSGTISAALTRSTKTANYTVQTTDNMIHFNNIGAGGSVTFTLPAAVAGLCYGFLVDAAHAVVVQTAGTDIIAIGGIVGGASGNVQCSTPYAFILIECHNSGKWIASSVVGSWTVI